MTVFKNVWSLKDLAVLYFLIPNLVSKYLSLESPKDNLRKVVVMKVCGEIFIENKNENRMNVNFMWSWSCWANQEYQIIFLINEMQIIWEKTKFLLSFLYHKNLYHVLSCLLPSQHFINTPFFSV